ncbi:hypothetical protein FA95DRAFT_1557413 [Auriscalpium vulgare]|uniref:Uncharacterized protein n=1 Tax=Auriscalpium vulgare TaxID=40419 RepID=A0ACB8RXP2_9AGAM|nr:hypothetical protein FA95DRAFT_1557413 [Auriscalpium vulgare]
MSTAASSGSTPASPEPQKPVEQPEATTSAATQPTDDNYKVYRPPKASAPPPSATGDFPEDYFEPTAADLKVAQATLHARTVALQNAPLQTRVMREQKEKAKLERWPNTTIRVRFNDQTQLEKVFPSSSKIRAVYAFVRGSLREDVKPIKFILSQSPPLRDLKVSDAAVRDLTLAQLQLAPSSVLLLRFEDDALNHSNVPAPLAANVLEQAIDLPPPPSYDDKGKSSPLASSSSRTLASSSSQPAAAPGEKKVPKWLKLGKK